MIAKFDKWTIAGNWNALRVKSQCFVLFPLAIAVVAAASGCSPQSINDERASLRLGTSWGETLPAKAESVTFSRAGDGTPEIAAAILYDDQQGLKSLLGNLPRMQSAPISLSDGKVLVGIVRSERGWVGSRYFPTVERDGKLYVAGNQNERYEISVENNSTSRIEVVASVDGLDVIDGRFASLSKPGYILEPGETTTIEGFRRNMDEVSAFRFGSTSGALGKNKKVGNGKIGAIEISVFAEAQSKPSR